MKRMIALVLSLVMALSLCAPAWGAGITNIGEYEGEGSIGDLPKADVTESTEDTNENFEWNMVLQWAGSGLQPVDEVDHKLEAAFTFTCADTPEQAKNGSYAEWNCDFYVKLDRDLGENEIILGGNYGSFGWIGLLNGELALKAGEEIPLLGSVGAPWTYEEIASGVGTFKCGVGDVDNALAGATFTVMLRLTNPKNTDEFYNVATVEYIFDATPVAEIDGWKYATLQDAVDAVKDGETIEILDNITITAATAGYSDGTYIDGVRYTGDKSFKVDFNGYTVTDDGCVNDYLIYVNNKGEKANEITLENGVIASKNGCWATICVNSSSSTQKTVLNLNGMQVSNSNGADYSGNQAVRVRNKGTVNVNANTVITSDNASYAVTPNTSDSVVNVNSGAKLIQKNSVNDGGNHTCAAVGGLGTANIYDGAVITSDNYGVYMMTSANPVVNVYGGTVTAKTTLCAATNGGAGQTSTINVSGGMFSGDLKELNKDCAILISGGYFTVDPKAYVAEGYGFLTSDKSGYDYKVGKVVATVAGVNYDTLQAAVDAVADKGTITVKADGQSATVSAAKTFTVVYADGVTKATITAGSGYTLSEKDGVYTVSKYVAPYYPPVTETPTEKPAETPAEKPAQTPAETPTTPAETPVEVVVPVVGNENTVKVEATVTGTTATVDKVDMAQLETVIGSDVDTGKVTIDFSTTAVTTGAVDSNGEIVEAAPVDTVQIPAEVIKQIAEAVADPENNAESLEVVLGDGASIEFDAAALAEKVAQAGGDDITISIKPTTAVADTLSQAQIFTLGESVAFDITVTSGGVEISDMGGNITISAPYELAEGETAEGIVVYYVDDAGNREKCETVYDAATGRVSWVTNHLSVYMVSYEAPVEDVTPDDGAVDETPVVDDAQSGSPVLWIVIAVVVIAAIVVAVVVSKKRKA